MTLYKKVMKGKRVTYQPIEAAREDFETRNLSDKQLVTAAVSLGTMLLMIYERTFPPHKRIVRKVQALELAILDLFKGTGEPIDEATSSWFRSIWNSAMALGENGHDSGGGGDESK